MKKIFMLIMVSMLTVGLLGGTALAANPVNAVVMEEGLPIEPALENLETEVLADAVDESRFERECISYEQLKDEFIILQGQRKITADLAKELAVKRVKIAALKEKARILGQEHKLVLAGLIEKEIKVFTNIVDEIREKKHHLWQDFWNEIEAGEIDKAEKTLGKIIVTKKLINENLRHISRLMTREIEILN